MSETQPMLKIAVCEDHPDTCKKIGLLLRAYRENHPGLLAKPEFYASATGLLEQCEKSGGYQIYLLDIVMPGLSGIEIAQKLREKDRNCVFIFLTSSEDFALEAFRVGALHYLVKPPEPTELCATLDRATALCLQRIPKTILVSTVRGRENLPLDSIVYVECRNHILTYHLSDGVVLPGRTIRTSFEVAMAPLLQERNFIHPHKSFILNADFVDRLTSQAFTMRCGAEIPITKSRYTSAKTKYLQYFDLSSGL